MTSFYSGVRGRDLIPGDPGTLRGLAGRLTTLGDGLSSAAGELQAIDAGSWQGTAANVFREHAHQQPRQYEAAAAGFSLGSSAIRTYAQSLEWAQQDADRAAVAYQDAEAATAAWRQRRDQGDPNAGPDPGESGRWNAEQTLAGARGRLDAAAAQLRAALDEAASSAPRKPALFSRMFNDAEHVGKIGVHDFFAFETRLGEIELSGGKAFARFLWQSSFVNAVIDPKGWWAETKHFYVEFGKGIWAGTTGTVTGAWDLTKFAWSISPMRLEIDPNGWRTSVEGDLKMAYGIGRAFVDDPGGFTVSFGKAITNWDEWRDDPSKAFGELVPAVILAFATGGAGGAADAMDEESVTLLRGAQTADDVTKATQLASTANRIHTIIKVHTAYERVDQVHGLAVAADNAAEQNGQGENLVEDEIVGGAAREGSERIIRGSVGRLLVGL